MLNGWNFYDVKKEFMRQGIIFDDVNKCPFRISQINKDYSYIETYPQYLIEPKNISDETLKIAAEHRTKKRVPTLSYYYNNPGSDKISGRNMAFIPSKKRHIEFKK